MIIFVGNHTCMTSTLHSLGVDGIAMWTYLELRGKGYSPLERQIVERVPLKERLHLRLGELDKYILLVSLGFTPEQIAEHIRASRNDNLHIRKQSRDG